MSFEAGEQWHSFNPIIYKNWRKKYGKQQENIKLETK